MDSDTLVSQLGAFRSSLKGLAGEASTLKLAVIAANVATPGTFHDEVIANITLAFRHLEDAAMRFGKGIQAAQGGESPLGGPSTPSTSTGQAPATPAPDTNASAPADDSPAANE